MARASQPVGILTPPTHVVRHRQSFSWTHPINIEDATDTRQEGEDSPEPAVHDRDYADGHREEACDAVRKYGVEAIALYAPIHTYGPERWGVYFNERVFFGVCRVASSLANSSWTDIVADMLHAVDRHELFHAAAELFGLVLEDFAFFRT